MMDADGMAQGLTNLTLDGGGGGGTSATTISAGSSNESNNNRRRLASQGRSFKSMVPIDPEPLPDPAITEAERRRHEVENQGRHYAMDCLDSLSTGVSYAFIRTLRPAIYGKVKLGMALEGPQSNGTYRMLTEQPVAIKIIKKDKLNGRSQEAPLKEIAVMQLLTPGHPNVIGLTEVVQDAENIYLILPFCDGGEICQWFERSRYMLREGVAREFFLQILSGLQYLHSWGVIHRDMSLENLLYDQKTKRCIIIDLGMCIKLPIPATSDILVRRQGYCGKLTYMSPEIYKNRDFYAAAIDIWALGVILFIMLTGIPPVETPSEIDPRFRMLSEGRLYELMDLWRVDFLSDAARDLLNGMLQVDPASRISLEEISAHSWVVNPIPEKRKGEQEDDGSKMEEAGDEEMKARETLIPG